MSLCLSEATRGLVGDDGAPEARRRVVEDVGAILDAEGRDADGGEGLQGVGRGAALEEFHDGRGVVRAHDAPARLGEGGVRVHQEDAEQGERGEEEEVSAVESHGHLGWFVNGWAWGCCRRPVDGLRPARDVPPRRH